MRVICYECGILYDLKKPYEDDFMSHGLCELCSPWVENNLKIELSQLISSHRPDSQQADNEPHKGDDLEAVKSAIAVGE